MPSRAVMSLSAAAISKACARLSSAHGPAIRANGRLLPKRTLPTATTAFGSAFFGVIAGDHEGRSGSGQPPSFQRGKIRRPQEHAVDVGEDRAVFLGFSAHLAPCRVGAEFSPFSLPLGHGFPGQSAVQIVAAVADQHGPETDLPDAMLLPDCKSLRLEPLLQRRQLPRIAGENSHLDDHGACRLTSPKRTLSAAETRF